MKALDELNLKYQKVLVVKEQAKSKKNQLLTIQEVHIKHLQTVQADIVTAEQKIYDLSNTLAYKKTTHKENILKDKIEYKDKQIFSLNKEYETCEKNYQFKFNKHADEDSRFNDLDAKNLK
jgi:hypothetical protein